jgi:outer membrane immunogenic protein
LGFFLSALGKLFEMKSSAKRRRAALWGWTMLRFRCVGIGLLSLVAMAGTVAAADLPARAYVKAPAAPIYGNWTGCYVGGNVGGVWEHNSTPIGIVDPTGIATAAFLAGAIPNSYSYDRSSWLGGGQLGCNYQVTNWVLGIETDFDGTNLNGGRTTNTAIPAFFPITSNVTQRMDWIGTTRGRLGVKASDRILAYVTGGVAYAHVVDSYFLSNVAGGGPVSSFASNTRTLVGWTAGGGLEFGIGRWSVKSEALYYDLGSSTLIRFCTDVGGAPCANPNTFHPARFENKGVIARVGLNYHFN